VSAPPPGKSGPANSFLPEDWDKLSPLVDAVLDAAPERRAALIAELCAGNPAQQEVLEQLVLECERETPLFERPAAERFASLADEAPGSLLPALLGERYRVGRELGRGGMARVYLARDEKHKRDVAIKVIRPELSASLGHVRFLREIEIASRLRHPNIVPLYDSGEVAGSLYFVMPYEEGPSLRERLAAGPLPIGDALSVLRDVARALAYAHEHGVMHRDVKPDNVMLSGGAAVVADFGIAKAVSAALTESGDPTLTQSGSAIGTPAYMAPEQATADPATDHRADIYSFGCLAYEMFTGSPPFANQSMHLVIAAHIGTPAPSVTALRADVPAPVTEMIALCLEKHPDARPQSARELLASLDRVSTTSTPTPEAAPAAAVTGIRRPARQFMWAGLAVIVSVIAATVYFTTRPVAKSPPISVAVLPFGNMGADSALSYVAEGLADEVAGALTRVPGIQIKSRNGARAYRGQLSPDVTEAGTRLKADYVITGVVRQERGRWILSVELARAIDKASLWDESITLDIDQQAGAAEVIGDTLVKALRGMFPNSIGIASALASNQRTSNSEAYRLYLRGQDKLDHRGGNTSVREGAELFRGAIHEDTNFARAYSGLSMALALFPYFAGSTPKEIRAGVVSEADRALVLDATLSQPHVALGMIEGYDYHWDSAEREFQTALRLDSRNLEARVQYARHLFSRGSTAEGLRQIRVAAAQDPASALVLSWLSYGYYLDGRMDSALVESRRALQNDSTNVTALGWGALIRLANNLPAEARMIVARGFSFGTNEYVVAMTSDPETIRQRLKQLDAQSPQPRDAESRRFFDYVVLRDTASALSALERATDNGEFWPLLWPPTDPMYATVRGSARFRALLRRVGLTP
jgi:TolB-like protein/tRNA A-37 threonylcarbamoyl transferase component Bud32